jgi:hypothetical protein
VFLIRNPFVALLSLNVSIILTGVARHRENGGLGPITGSYTSFIFPDPKYVSWNVGSKQECDDIVGSRETANLFILVNDNVTTFLADGEYRTGSGTLIKKLNGIPLAGPWVSPPDPRDVYPLPGFLEKSNVAWEILSKSNPNVPQVPIPAFVGEGLGGIASKVKRGIEKARGIVEDTGYASSKSIARGTVGAHFDLIPLINDFKKMLQFQRALQHRLNWLRHLAEGKPIKRRVSLGAEREKQVNDAEVNLHTESATFKGKYQTSYYKEEWGTVQWKLEPWFKIPKDNAELTKLAERLTWDISLDGLLNAAWEFTPWSWFTDWFLGVGAVIDATRNTVPLQHSHLCMMRTSGASRTYQCTSKPSWATVSGSKTESRTRKERFPISPMLPFPVTIPAITSRQWSILGAISFLKGSSNRRSPG